MESPRAVWTALALGAAVSLGVVLTLRSEGPPVTTVATSAPRNVAVATPVPRPPQALAEFGILSERPIAELLKLLDRRTLAGMLDGPVCGDDETCAAVRRFVVEGEGVHLEVVPAKNWKFPVDLAHAASSLLPAERDGIKKYTSLVVVATSGQALPEQLPVRAAFALTAVLARRIDGLVFDQLLDRIERPLHFASRVITAPLEAGAFRRECIDLQYTPRADGTVRLITVGLGRFGAPDLEVVGITMDLAQRLTGSLLEVANAVTFDEAMTPLALGDLELHLEKAVPEPGDPRGIMVRLVAPSDAGAEYFEQLAGTFPDDTPDTPPNDELMAETRGRAQKVLADVLARHKKASKDPLYVQVPFGDTDAGGGEWMWIEVVSFDEQTVTGMLVDEPDTLVDLHKGDRVTRARLDVADYVLKLADGGIESASAH